MSAAFRHPRTQGRLASFALLAMLLLALLPTTGRFKQALAPTETLVSALSASMCLPSGLAERSPALLREAALRWRSLGFPYETPPDEAPPYRPDPNGHGTADCAYCPLSSGLLLLVLGLAWATRYWGGHARVIAYTSVCVPRAYYPCGLGSRGPPSARLHA